MSTDDVSLSGEPSVSIPIRALVYLVRMLANEIFENDIEIDTDSEWDLALSFNIAADSIEAIAKGHYASLKLEAAVIRGYADNILDRARNDAEDLGDGDDEKEDNIH